jgi:hypothetical protein
MQTGYGSSGSSSSLFGSSSGSPGGQRGSGQGMVVGFGGPFEIVIGVMGLVTGGGGGGSGPGGRVVCLFPLGSVY